ncbi:MAG: hypothetical protein V1695_01290 [Candidatus Uhrbacteria bacterium]
MSYKLKFVAIGSLAVLLLVGGTSVYAYESDEVSEGHILHPIKEGIEMFEGKLSQGKPEGRAGYHLKMMSRRLDEVGHQEMEERRERLLTTAAEELDMTVKELKDAMFDPQIRMEIIEQLDQENGRFLGMLGPPLDMMPPPMLEQMQEIGSDIMENDDLTWEEKRDQMHERMRVHWEEMNPGQELPDRGRF